MINKLLFSILFFLIVFTPILSAYAAIPPTPAYRTVRVASDNVTATNSTGIAEIKCTNGISCIADWFNNLITISFGGATGTTIFVPDTLESLTNVTDNGCTLDQVRKAAANATWVCADMAAGGGEANTASNVGTGVGVFRSKVGVDLTFHSLLAGAGITINDIGDELRINSTATGGNATVLTDLGDVDLIGPSSSQFLRYNGTYWVNTAVIVGNATTLDDLGDVIITSPAYQHVMIYNGSVWVNRAFSINNQTVQNDFQIVGINNQTGVITTNQFSVNTLACGGTNKISSIDNVTGDVICTVDVDTQNSGNATVLNELGDVVITSPIDDNFLRYNGVQWVNEAVTIGTGNATRLNELGDVALDADGTPLTNEVLTFNGTHWTNATASAGSGITSVSNAGIGEAKLVFENGTTFARIKSIQTNANVTVTNGTDGTVGINTTNTILYIGGAAQTVTKALTTDQLILGGGMNANTKQIFDIGSLVQTGVPATAGFVRLANGQFIEWRDASDSGNFGIRYNSDNNFEVESNVDLQNSSRIINLATPFNPNDAQRKNRIGDVNMTLQTPANGTVLKFLASNNTAIWQDDNTGGAGGGNATNLNDLGDVVITSATYRDALLFNGVQWANKAFSINNQTVANDFQVVGINNATGVITTNQFSVNLKTCSGTDKVSAIDNATGDVICSADVDTTNAGNATVLTELGDVIISSVATDHILQYNGSQFVNKLFKIDNGTCTGTDVMNGINNATGDYNCVAAGTGGGEANTASNIGTAGFGFFKQKTGVNLEFRNATVASGNLTLAQTADDVQFNLGSNVVITGGSAQTITKGLTTNALTLGGAMDANNNQIFNFNNLAQSGVPASSGALRLGNGQYINWRDSGDSSNFGIRLDSSNNFVIESNIDLAGSSRVMGLAIPVTTTDAQRVNRIGLVNMTVGVPANGTVLKFLASNNTAIWQDDNTGGAGGGNATNLNDLGDVVITSATYRDALLFNGVQWANKAFSINNQTVANDFQIVGINNATGVITTNQFSVNLKTCSSTDKVSAIDNATGDVTCSSDVDTVNAGNATILTELGDVIITSVATDHIIQYNGSQFINKLFKIDNGTCTGTDVMNGINNATGDYNCVAASAGGGEANTASNIGTAGFGFFKQKSGVDLQFRNATVASGNLTLAQTADDVQFNLGSNVVITGGSAQTITKGLTTNALTLGGNEAADNFLITGYGTPTLGTDAQRVNRLALADLTIGTCADGSPIEYQTSNSTWICGTDANSGGNATVIKDLGDVDYAGSAPLTNNVLKYNGTHWTNATDSGLTAAITSINSDTTASQTIAVESGNLTMTDAGASHTIGFGINPVITGGSAQTITKNVTLNTLVLGGTADAFGKTITNIGILNSSSSDTADAGFMRLGNADLIAWEASPAGTDLTIQTDANEDFVWSVGFNNINFNSNPLINTVLRSASTGNTVTADPRIAILTAGGATLQAAATPSRTTIDATNMDYMVLDFDTTSAETVIWNWEVPEGMDATQDVTVRVRFQVSSGTAGVCFDGSWLGRTNAETVDAAFGTVVGACDSSTGTNAIETATITFTTGQHGLAAGDSAFFKLTRDVADATDTNANDARVIDVRVSYS